jgi:hypothetical protein
VRRKQIKVVTNIPLSPSLPQDRLIWNGTINGIFSVRSAYHLGKDIQQRSRGECLNTDKGMDVWKALWSLKVHNSVKLFMWKACNNLLPSKLNLFRRGVVVDNLCPYYWREEESVIHALWSCPAAQDVWGCGPLIFQKSCSLGTSFLSNFASFLMLCSKDELDLLAVLARRI